MSAPHDRQLLSFLTSPILMDFTGGLGRVSTRRQGLLTSSRGISVSLGRVSLNVSRTWGSNTTLQWSEAIQCLFLYLPSTNNAGHQGTSRNNIGKEKLPFSKVSKEETLGRSITQGPDPTVLIDGSCMFACVRGRAFLRWAQMMSGLAR